MRSIAHNTASQQPKHATMTFSQDHGFLLRLEKVPTSNAVMKKAKPAIEIASAWWRLSLVAPYICRYRIETAIVMAALTTEARTYEFENVMVHCLNQPLGRIMLVRSGQRKHGINGKTPGTQGQMMGQDIRRLQVPMVA